MAVSLTQLSEEATRRRRAAGAGAYTNKMAHHRESMYMPMPEHFHQESQYEPAPPPQHYGAYGYPTPAPYYNGYAPAPQYAYPPPQYTYDNGTQQQQFPPPPPRPPKTPIESIPSSHYLPPPQAQAQPTSRPHSQSQPAPPPRPTTFSIEPDPLPPHTNPQALTQTQSAAFQNSQPIPPVRLGRDTITNAQTGESLFTITREAAHMPSFLSSKPYLTIRRTASGIPSPMGTIKFHTMLSSNIEMNINSRTTSITHEGLLHNRWEFQSTTVPNEDAKWFWKKDKFSRGAKLEDSKKSGGRMLAKMKGNLLTFETAKLSKESYDEVLLSAIAMAEAARRQRKGSDIADLAGAVGDFAASDGGSSGGGDGGGGGGDGGGGAGGAC